MRPFQNQAGVPAQRSHDANRWQATLVLVALIAVMQSLTFCGSAIAQTSTNWRLERHSIERPFATDLQTLANDLRSSGDAKGSRNVVAQYSPRDLQREYIYLPGTEFAASDSVGWQARLQELKKTHAQRVFELAQQAADNGGGAAGFQFLNEVLVLDPDHEQARKALGHRRTEKGWRIASELVKNRKSTKREPTMGWEAGSFLRVSTPHFEIHSIADETTTLELAEKLERWHDVWRQVFFEFWSSEKSLQRWLDGTSQLRPSKKKYQVIFFDGKESYAEQLEPKIKGIGASTGYYSDQLRASFFYASEDEAIQETWRHELTHQLFQQSIRTKTGPFRENYVWLGEGIATYFESMLDFGDHVTLGGFDSRRLQYARIRWNREGFRLQLSEISKISLEEFQRSKSIRRLYSQSSGMSHMLMNSENGKYQQRLIEFLKLMYTGKLRDGTFTKLTGLDDANFESEYSAYLRTKNPAVEQFLTRPLTRTELAMGNPQLSQRAFAEIGKCTNLDWLDLSDNRIDSARLACLKGCDVLQEIYFSNCQIEDGAMEELAELRQLTQVDLTASSCTDSQFLELAKCNGLESVTITATGISDDAILQFQEDSPNTKVLK